MIVIISGKAESGKTSLANMIKKEMGKNNELGYVFSFGTAVKSVAVKLGWDGKKDEKGRALLQMLGDGVRDYHSGFWVKKMIKEIEETFEDFGRVDQTEPHIIIDDARYLNEITTLKEFFPHVKTIRITRRGHQNKLTEQQRSHPSECSLDFYEDWDYEVYNDKDLPNLEEIAERIVQDVIS